MTRDYDEAIAARYDREERGVPGDVAFYVRMAREAPPVLELGCGTGRVALPIARVGAPVVGLDRSAAMLRRARERARPDDPVHWVLADMRAFSLRERFGLVIAPHRTVQHLLHEADVLAALRCVRDHLRPGGRFAFNVFNPDLPVLTDRREPVRGAVYGRLPVRYYRRSELERLLADAGFRVEALYGGFPGRPFTATSTEMVWVTRPGP